VRLIKWAQGLGFSLREIAALARIPRDHVRGRAARVRSEACAKIREIDTKILQLQAVKRRLRAIVSCHCDGHCPIVTAAASQRGSR